MMVNKAIFLDRDGVLNKVILQQGKPYPPRSIDELTIEEGVQEALNILRSMGFLLIGATNQPDVARGTVEQRVVEDINTALLTTLKLHEIRVCYHDDRDKCECRKPRPGLLLSAANDYNINLQQSFMIGDRWKDIEAGKNAGCKTIWLNQGYQDPLPPRPADFIATDLLDAAVWIMQQTTLIKEYA